jgi:hypothetical protein
VLRPRPGKCAHVYELVVKNTAEVRQASQRLSRADRNAMHDLIRMEAAS